VDELNQRQIYAVLYHIGRIYVPEDQWREGGVALLSIISNDTLRNFCDPCYYNWKCWSPVGAYSCKRVQLYYMLRSPLRYFGLFWGKKHCQLGGGNCPESEGGIKAAFA
jgi:hypothetical protein